MILGILLVKSVIWSVSLGSGTSGGLLAPMFMSGAAMGGAFAMALNKVFPSAHLSPGAFALVAMGAVFGAASRATFSFIIFAFEITRDYNSVLPLMLVSVIADGVCMLLMPSASIMTEKLRRRGLRIPHEYEADVLHYMTVSETMDQEISSIPATMKIGELADRIARGEPQVTVHHGMIILDEQGEQEDKHRRRGHPEEDALHRVRDAGVHDLPLRQREAGHRRRVERRAADLRAGGRGSAAHRFGQLVREDRAERGIKVVPTATVNQSPRRRVRFGVVEAINGNIRMLINRGRGYKNMRYLLLKARRMAVTNTEYVAFQKTRKAA